jgi:hypothetical protein
VLSYPLVNSQCFILNHIGEDGPKAARTTHRWRDACEVLRCLARECSVGIPVSFRSEVLCDQIRHVGVGAPAHTCVCRHPISTSSAEDG